MRLLAQVPTAAPQASIYERALGSDFRKLHPMIQRRFALTSSTGSAFHCRGTMHRIWRTSRFAGPFLALGTTRNILFPETGEDIPFTCDNHAYRDALGRETVSWIRTFHFPTRTRRFDAYMTYSIRRGCIIDYLGTHQHLAVDLDLSVDEQGGLVIHSGEQRFYEHLVGVRLPQALCGAARVREWFDDQIGRYRISVRVSHPRLGEFCGYEGTFEAFRLPVNPASNACRALPQRLEWRE